MDMPTVFQWLTDNKLTLNMNKTTYMFFHKPSFNFPLEYISSYIFKYIGLRFDSTLSWDTHINFLKNKVSPIIGILFSMRHLNIPCSVLKYIFYSLIHCHLCSGQSSAFSSFLNPSAVVTFCEFQFYSPLPFHFLQHQARGCSHLLPFVYSQFLSNQPLTSAHRLSFSSALYRIRFTIIYVFSTFIYSTILY